MSPRGNKVGFVSLGCPKALVDSERIVTRLRAEGYRIAADYESADMVVVNTCGFIDEAVNESLDAIGEAIEANGKVVVTGCLGHRAEFIRQSHPKVLAVTGPNATDEVVGHIHAQMPPDHDPISSLLPPGGIKLTPRHYAYLKISEGCNNSCSFCIIPDLRGKLSSRSLAEVQQEAENLVRAGVKELLVISQDTGAYGQDLRYRQTFVRARPMETRILSLCRLLAELKVWVRLHYLYPYPHIDRLIPMMADGQLLPYLDIPFQHSHPRVLKRMRRPANTEKVLERLAAWRRQCPDLTIRSTFIVGFPGETESEFEHLLDFLREARLDRVGCFAYSEVRGAQANALEGLLDDSIKQERRARFMEVQEAISREKLMEKIDRTIPVIVDEVFEDQWNCRSEGDAPEIDGQVIVDNVDPSVIPGEVLLVRVTASDDHNLYGVAVDDSGG